MTDLLSLWREARGPEPALRPRVFWEDDMHAHYAAAVTEDALARFAEKVAERLEAELGSLQQSYGQLLAENVRLRGDAERIRGTRP